MTAQLPPFYKNVVPLSKEQHKDLHLQSVSGYSFANQTSSIFIAASEFAYAACEYPIVFGQDARGGLFPAVLLGLKKGQNLFLSRDGTWSAKYIPTYARRYPFILANPADRPSQLMVCIDRDYPGFNTSGQGQALFDESGKETEFLIRAIEFLKSFQKLVSDTQSFCRSLVSLELLEPVQADVELASGEKYGITGFQCVSRAKLKALTDKTLTDLFKTDQLELIYLHLNSLANIDKMTVKHKGAGGHVR